MARLRNLSSTRKNRPFHLRIEWPACAQINSAMCVPNRSVSPRTFAHTLTEFFMFVRWLAALSLCLFASTGCQDNFDDPVGGSQPIDEIGQSSPPADYDGAYLDAGNVLELWRSPVRGNPDAFVTLVAFEEFNCPHCKKVQPTLDALLNANDGDLRLFYKHFPLPQFPEAFPSARAARAAFRQDAFWPYHDLLFEHQDALSDAQYISFAETLSLNLDAFETDRADNEVHQEVLADQALGQRLDVRGTPTFFINGKRVTSGATIETLQQIVDDELAQMHTLIDEGHAPSEALGMRISLNLDQN